MVSHQLHGFLPRPSRTMWLVFSKRNIHNVTQHLQGVLNGLADSELQTMINQMIATYAFSGLVCLEKVCKSPLVPDRQAQRQQACLMLIAPVWKVPYMVTSSSKHANRSSLLDPMDLQRITNQEISMPTPPLAIWYISGISKEARTYHTRTYLNYAQVMKVKDKQVL